MRVRVISACERAAELEVVRPARVLDHEVGDASRGDERDRRVDTALEAPRRLGRQLVPPRRAGDRHGVEGRGLDEHVAGARSHLGRAAAHDAGETDRTRLVGDEQVLGVERAHLAVERLELLARRRAAHRDAALQPVEVVAVDRLAELEHHVVRDVDQDAERADAGEREPRDHPRRRGLGRVDVAHDARDELRRADAPADRGDVVDGDRESRARPQPHRTGRTAGSRKAAPVACEYSRATPRIDSA